MRTRCITTIERALARAGSDADFRVQVLVDGRGVQAAYQLHDVEWHVLVSVVARLEQLLTDTPLPGEDRDGGITATGGRTVAA